MPLIPILFDGDYDAAIKFNPILSRYIPAMARFLRESPCPKIHVSYEDITQDPEDVLSKISGFLEIPFEPDAVNTLKKKLHRGWVIPLVYKNTRDLCHRPFINGQRCQGDSDKFAVVAKQVAGCSDEDLNTWGYPKRHYGRKLKKWMLPSTKNERKNGINMP